MSIRKIAGLAAGFALTVGLIGAGVGAQFTGQVSAIENVNVGTFGCTIDSQQGNVVGDTVTYNAPTITSSAADSAPFAFTVRSTGSIPAQLQLTQTTPAAPFTSLLANPADVVLTQSQTHTYNAGLQWPELVTANLGQSATITYTVACTEVRHPTLTVAVTGPVVGDAGSPLAGQNVLKLTSTGAGFDNGPAIVLSYTAGYPGETYADAETAFGHADPNTSSFTAYFEDNCSVNGNGIPTVGSDVPFTITATQGINVASFTGILTCSLVTNFA
jgi:hypothetical protein